MLQFHRVELSERSCDSSTGQGERASIERYIAAGPLRDTVSLSNERWGNETNVSSRSLLLTLGEERLRNRVSTGDSSSG
jgi:hypothetical protein